MPPLQDGTKHPIKAWKGYQSERATGQQVAEWYANGRTGLGIVTGAVSGNLEILEFDDRDVYERFRATAARLGLNGLVDRIEDGYLEESPSGGIHWFYFCDVVGGNSKLAERPDPSRGPNGRKPLIETRGEGGFVITAPSCGKVHPTGKPYRLIRGGFPSIATITPEERADLWALARTFNEVPPPAPKLVKSGTARKEDAPGAIKPGEAFEADTSWADLLEPEGWRQVDTAGDQILWRRPGKDRGTSATTGGFGRDYLWVFTSSTAFETSRSYTKFNAYALLKHGGDLSAAARALRAAGYGSCAKPPSIHTKASKPSPPSPEADVHHQTPPPTDTGAPVAPAAAPIRPNEGVSDPWRLARKFTRVHASHPDGPTVRYWNGEWHRWNGSSYQPTMDKEIGAELTRAIKAEFNRVNIAQIRKHADSKEDPPKVLPVTTKLVNNVSNALKAQVLLRKNDCPRQPAWLDGRQSFPAEEVLSTRNALVHLPTFMEGRGGILRPSPRFFCPYALDYEFDANAHEPVNWLTFLGERRVVPGSEITRQLWPDDPQSRDTLQEWYGLNLLPITRYQKILTLIGPKRCGKGTIARVLTSLVGQDNVANPTLSSLATNFGPSVLIGKLSAIVTDARLTGRADIGQLVERLLAITGEDGQTIDRKHKDQWTGKLAARFTVISNEVPRLSDQSAAMPSRMILLRLTKSFYGEEDETLMEKLLPELPGIMLWAIEGLKRLRARGRFIQPDSGRPLVEEMEELASPIGMFAKECLNVGAGRECRVPDAFARWKEWCAEKNKDYVGDESAFGRNLRSIMPDLETKPAKAGGKYFRVFQGFDLVTDNRVFDPRAAY